MTPDLSHIKAKWYRVEGVPFISWPNPYTLSQSAEVEVPPGGIATISTAWRTTDAVKVYGVAGFSQDVGTPIYVPGYQGCTAGELGRCGNQYCGFGMDHCRHAKNPFARPRFSYDSVTKLAQVSWCFANEATISRQAVIIVIAEFTGTIGPGPDPGPSNFQFVWAGEPGPEFAEEIQDAPPDNPARGIPKPEFT
jgi:hypothetical protein